MLGMVAAKTAIAKKIDKNARGKMQEAAPAVIKALGGMPRLKNGVGRNSWKKAMQKAKEKNNSKSLEGPSQAPGRIDFNPNAGTAPPDRSPDEVPTKSIFARMTGYFPPTTRMYNSALPKPMPEDAEGLQELSPSVQKNMGYTEDEDGNPITRHMKFCGGASKPYKKK